MACPHDCTPSGKYEPTEVTVEQIRLRLHDTDPSKYAFSDEEIKMRINDATLIAGNTLGCIIDEATGWPATKIDWLIVSLLTCRELLQSFVIRVAGGGSGSGATTTECNGGGSFAHLAFIDSMSEGSSSISFASISDIQSTIDKINEEIEQLKISRWGCALYVSTGNY